MRMPAASRSAISSRSASATWRAVSPSGWSSRTNDHARIVTGPVSMPLTGLAVRLCAYLDQSTGDRLGPGHVTPKDRRTCAPGSIGLHPAVLGDGEAVQVLGKVLHHIVAFGLAVHEDVQADLLLQVDNTFDLGLHEADVLGLAQDVPGQLCAGATDVAGLWERADRRGGQKGQVKSRLLRGEAIRVLATGEVLCSQGLGACPYGAIAHARRRPTSSQSSRGRAQLPVDGLRPAGQSCRERRDLPDLLVGEGQPTCDGLSEERFVVDVVGQV